VSREPQPRRPRAERVSTYRPTLVTLALLCALLALLVLLIAQHAELGSAAHAFLRNPSSLAPREIALLTLAGAIPLAAAIAAYVIAAQAVRLLRIWLYLARLHAYVGRRLRTAAPLYSRGLSPRLQRIGRHGASPGESLPVRQVLRARAPVLLSGEAGSGKTTALLSLSYELTRRRATLPVFFGRQPLPVLVPLAGYAADLHGAAGPQLTYLQRQVARYGSPGLTTRLPRLLRQGRVLLLCDSLSDVPVGTQGRILEDLALVPPAGSGPSVILARTATLGATVPEYIDIEWEHWRVAPLSTDDVLRTAQAALPRATPRRSSQRGYDLRQELQRHRLDRALRTPALLLALTSVAPERSADAPLPDGRAALLMDATEAACAREATPDLPAEHLAVTLGALASALAHADQRAVPLAPGLRLGDAVATWMAQHRPYSPLRSAQSGPLSVPAEVAHACCLAGLRAGILAVTSDDSGLTFAHSLAEAAFAVRWLRATDDGASPFDTGLLRPRWVLPIILWTATAPDPGTITRRLLPLLLTPDEPRKEAHAETRRTVAPAAHATSPRLSRPAGAALALAGIAAAVAPTLSAALADGDRHDLEIARFERRLREVLDAVLELLAPQHPALLTAVQSVESIVGDDLAADIAYLASVDGFSGLARAQLISLLGLLASPLALSALQDHLADKDPTLRSAVSRGFALAGGRGVAALQGQLSSQNNWVRARASEILDGISAAQLADATSAHLRAVHALASDDPAARAAAAETLGALQAHDTVDALSGRLADPDPAVRLAALGALAKLANPAALPILREQVRHHEPAFRAALAEALGGYHDPMLIPDLSLLLEDSDPGVRTAAAAALGMMRDPRAATPLQQRRGDPDPRVQAAIASALRRLSTGREGTGRPQPGHLAMTALPAKGTGAG
jgi:HEAT repeat protein